jgi:hypothetical protein
VSVIGGHGFPEDQVARHMEFRSRHPEVTTSYDRRAGQWNATWPGDGKGKRKFSSLELKVLLDQLEKELGS